ncbi:DUF2651 domain-containing protein [Bacillus sp. SL00103]
MLKGVRHMAVFILFVVFGFPILFCADWHFWHNAFEECLMPTLIVLLASIILMYTSIGGNESFLIWVIIYTVFTYITMDDKAVSVQVKRTVCTFSA